MAKATLPGRFNSNGGEHVNTLMHRCMLLDEDVSYHPEDLRQGRDCKTPVPRFSPLAGLPERTEADNTIRVGFWSFYAAVLLTLFCVVLLAIWPN